MIQVFIIDDHPMVVAGIQALLQYSDEVQICGSAHDARTAIEALSSSPAQVVLIDINLPDMNGIDLCILLKKQFHRLKMLGLSTFKERSYISRMIEAGASGYLLKNASREELEDAVVAVHKGRTYFSLEVASTLAVAQQASPSIPILTAREKEVLNLIAEGLTNQEIADKLFISVLTVDSHRKNLLAKFGVKNTASMINTALKCNLITLSSD